MGLGRSTGFGDPDRRFSGGARGETSGRRGAPLVGALMIGLCVSVVIVALALPRVGVGFTLALIGASLILLLAACLTLCRPFEQAQEEWRAAVARAAKHQDCREPLPVSAAARLGTSDGGKSERTHGHDAEGKE